MSFKKIFSTIKSYNNDKDDLPELNDEYIAFISYSGKEKDKKIANDLHKYLEKYFNPKIKKKNKQDLIFIDRRGLNIGELLSVELKKALQKSAYLIVVCSPNAVASKWVDIEIKYFLETLGRTRQNIIPIIISGKVDSDTNIPNSLKPYIQIWKNEIGKNDLLYPNYEEDGIESFDKILAKLENLPYIEFVEKIKKEKKERVLKRTKFLAGIIIILGILFGIFLIIIFFANSFFDKMISFLKHIKELERIPFILTIVAIVAIFYFVKKFVETILDLFDD
ncbi:MAG: toll/interleukin-1 receptor domain-containing protein [Bacteroidetes bacterium]|nr:toll/interleukin-1 receptor domain-containing protein [Bacteroidota bacterium]MCL2303451.1 toll/interleukin-1 receptor domain-containing protein [Lentimicrobiaceae bacterium]